MISVHQLISIASLLSCILHILLLNRAFNQKFMKIFQEEMAFLRDLTIPHLDLSHFASTFWLVPFNSCVPVVTECKVKIAKGHIVF